MIHYITTQGTGDAWVANELRIVEGAGIPFTLHALRAPQQWFFASPWVAELRQKTRGIYPISAWRLALSFLMAPWLFGFRFFAALANALFGSRESWRARLVTLYHFAVACHWARELRRDRPKLIHSQWIHSGGSVGMYGAWLLGVPFSFTGHAADLFRERVALRDKIRRAEFIVCISSFHRDFFLQNGADPKKLRIVYCGIDPSAFSPSSRVREPGDPLKILSSGRLIEKKGFEYLIDACRVLADRGLDFRCSIVGSGPIEKALRERIDRQGLADRVTVSGEAIRQEDIPAFMRGGDLFCLPCVWASDGDVDGLPQMLMEAMACGLPAISTRLVGIPDLIQDGETGLLVEPREAAQLANAIASLAQNPELANRLALAGRRRILEKFDIASCLAPLLTEYRVRLGGSRVPQGDANEPVGVPAPSLSARVTT